MQSVMSIQKNKSKITAATLPYKKADTCYWLTPEEASVIQVYRLADHPEIGFQRRLWVKKVQNIVKDLNDSRSMPYPAIYCALIDGVLWSVDGQHRLKGHLEAGKPILVLVWDMNEEQARETFCRDNGSSTSLSREHTTKVSNAEKTAFMKELCEVYDVDWAQVTVLMDSICGTIGEFSRDNDFTSEQRLGAQTFLSVFTKQSKNSKLWVPTEKTTNTKTLGGKKKCLDPSSAYSSKATIGACGRDIHNRIEKGLPYKKRLLAIANGDWQKESKGFTSLRMMATQTGKTGAKLMLEFMKVNILDGLGE